MADGDFEAQGPDFDLKRFIGDYPRHHTKNFYCPSCGEKVVFHLLTPTEDDNYECPTCQSIMLLEEGRKQEEKGGEDPSEDSGKGG